MAQAEKRSSVLDFEPKGTSTAFRKRAQYDLVMNSPVVHLFDSASGAPKPLGQVNRHLAPDTLFANAPLTIVETTEEILRRDHLDRSISAALAAHSLKLLAGKLTPEFLECGLNEAEAEAAAAAAMEAVEKLRTQNADPRIAEIAAMSEAELIEAWKQIPTYKDEKRRRIQAAQEAAAARGETVGKRGHWDMQRHFDEFWMPFLEAGLLFRDVVSKFDREFSDNLTTYIARGALPEDRYKLPIRAQSEHLNLDM